MTRRCDHTFEDVFQSRSRSQRQVVEHGSVNTQSVILSQSMNFVCERIDLKEELVVVGLCACVPCVLRLCHEFSTLDGLFFGLQVDT